VTEDFIQVSKLKSVVLFLFSDTHDHSNILYSQLIRQNFVNSLATMFSESDI